MMYKSRRLKQSRQKMKTEDKYQRINKGEDNYKCISSPAETLHGK